MHMLADFVLPSNWTKCCGDGSTIFSKVQPNSLRGSVVTHTLTIQTDNTWTIHVLGREVNISRYFVLKGYSPTVHSTKVNNLLTAIDGLHICPGHPDNHFVDMLKNKNDVTKSRSAIVLDDFCDLTFNHQSYNVTVRHTDCEILVVDTAKCPTCTAYRSTLRALYSRYTKNKCNPHHCSPRSHTNLRYLRTPERQKRFHSMKARAKAVSRKVSSLRISKELSHSGVQLDEQLNHDMTMIMDECNERVEHNYPANSFERIFWEEQKKAKQLKNLKQMRWHPMLIKWCLRMKLISSSAYSAFRSSGLLKLPSERTLRDYTHWIKARPGFQVEVDRQLIEEAKLTSIPDFQKYVCVVFDEVKIKEGLVYDKEECNLVGFVELDDINNHLQAFEKSLSTSASKPTLATHVVVFMVRGLFSASGFQFPYSSLNGHTLYALVW